MKTLRPKLQSALRTKLGNDRIQLEFIEVEPDKGSRLLTAVERAHDMAEKNHTLRAMYTRLGMKLEDN